MQNKSLINGKDHYNPDCDYDRYSENSYESNEDQSFTEECDLAHFADNEENDNFQCNYIETEQHYSYYEQDHYNYVQDFDLIEQTFLKIIQKSSKSNRKSLNIINS